MVRVYRGDGARREIRDLNVSTLLRGDFGDAHTRGNQASVLPADSQKNTCFAFAKEKGVGEIEDYALELARYFARDIRPVGEARVEVEEYRWERVSLAGQPHPHTFKRTSDEVRTTAVTVGEFKRELARTWGVGTWVVSGLKDLVVLKSAGSQFSGFLDDRYTTLAETGEPILATSLTARWRYRVCPPKSWDEACAEDAGPAWDSAAAFEG